MPLNNSSGGRTGRHPRDVRPAKREHDPNIVTAILISKGLQDGGFSLLVGETETTKRQQTLGLLVYWFTASLTLASALFQRALWVDASNS